MNSSRVQRAYRRARAIRTVAGSVLLKASLVLWPFVLWPNLFPAGIREFAVNCWGVLAVNLAVTALLEWGFHRGRIRCAAELRP